MLCSHFTQNCILLYFLEAKNPYFVTKNCWKSSYICVFILSKKRRSWFHKNLHNSGMVGRRKLPEPCWIAYLMLYRLMYNIRPHFNELILTWSAYLKLLKLKENSSTALRLLKFLILKKDTITVLKFLIPEKDSITFLGLLKFLILRKGSIVSLRLLKVLILKNASVLGRNFDFLGVYLVATACYLSVTTG